jgi:hypothetical protein
MQQLHARAGRDTYARGNGPTGHYASHPVSRHQTAAANCGKTLAPAAGSEASP